MPAALWSKVDGRSSTTTALNCSITSGDSPYHLDRKPMCSEGIGKRLREALRPRRLPLHVVDDVNRRVAHPCGECRDCPAAVPGAPTVIAGGLAVAIAGMQEPLRTARVKGKAHFAGDVLKDGGWMS